MSVVMWNFYSSPLDVISNVKLPFFTIRCEEQNDIAILDQ